MKIGYFSNFSVKHLKVTKVNALILFSIHYFKSFLISFLSFCFYYTIAKFIIEGDVFSCFDFRSSRPEVFCKKAILRNFAKFTGENLCQGLFFNKVAGSRPAALFKKRLWHRCFPVNLAKFLTKPFLTEHLWATASMIYMFFETCFLFKNIFRRYFS